MFCLDEIGIYFLNPDIGRKRLVSYGMNRLDWNLSTFEILELRFMGERGDELDRPLSLG